MAKIALIIQPDTERRHLENMERSLGNYFETEGEAYETYVASPEKPSAPHDHYFRATSTGIQRMIQAARSTMGPEDELFIYTTGHGELDKGRAVLCLENGCRDTIGLARLLDGIPSKIRRIVMDQCYSGNWNRIFMDDPSTLFISPGSRNETVCCQEMAPRLWAPANEIPDLNEDGIVSWQERYAYAAVGIQSSSPQFLVSPGYVPDGRGSFEKGVVEVADKEGLERALKKLYPGQYAIITFAADWCATCKAYAPQFDAMAKNGTGQHLWIRTENEDLAKMWGIMEYPTVVVVNSNGQGRVLVDRNNVEVELAGFELSKKERLSNKLAAAERVEVPYRQTKIFRRVISDPVEEKPKKDVTSVLNQLTSAAKKIKDPSDRVHAFLKIAAALVEAGPKEKAASLFKRSIAAAKKIKNPVERSQVFGAIDDALGEAWLNGGMNVCALCDQLIAYAENIEDLFERVDVLNAIDNSFQICRGGGSFKLTITRTPLPE